MVSDYGYSHGLQAVATRSTLIRHTVAIKTLTVDVNNTCKANATENQPRITSFVKCKLPGVKSHLTNQIACVCSQDLRLFAVVEGQGFINVAKVLLNSGSRYGSNGQVEDIISCARTVSRHVGGEYEKLKIHLKVIGGENMKLNSLHCLKTNFQKKRKEWEQDGTGSNSGWEWDGTGFFLWEWDETELKIHS